MPPWAGAWSAAVPFVQTNSVTITGLTPNTALIANGTNTVASVAAVTNGVLVSGAPPTFSATPQVNSLGVGLAANGVTGNLLVNNILSVGTAVVASTANFGGNIDAGPNSYMTGAAVGSPDMRMTRVSATIMRIWDGTTDQTIQVGKVAAATMATATNCASSASPAVCGSAASGSAVIAAAATSVVVNTSAVTANSVILVTEDQSLGSKLSVTCNTQSDLVVGTPEVSARSAGVSFTVIVPVAPTTNPACFNYVILN